MRGCGGGWVVAGGGWAVRRIRRDTVNERAVRILLECILVFSMFQFVHPDKQAKNQLIWKPNFLVKDQHTGDRILTD